MKKTTLIIGAILLLSSCTTPQEKCESYGHVPGTEAYANCLQRLDEIKQQKKKRPTVCNSSGSTVICS